MKGAINMPPKNKVAATKNLPRDYGVFKKEWLAEVLNGNPSPTEKGNRFSNKLITQWLDLNEEGAEIVYCDGAGDGGIDMACLVRGEEPADKNPADGDTWYVVQSKYGSAFAGEDTLFKEARKVIDTLSGHRKKLSSLAAGLQDRLMTFIASASERDRLVLVFATVDPLTESEKRTLEDVVTLGRSRLGPRFNVDSVSVNSIFEQLSEVPTSATIGPVELKASVSDSGDGLLVGTAALESLYNFLYAYRSKSGELDRIYEKNVRRYLGGKRQVNAAIRQTLEEKPERFGLYNNGITIVADNVDSKDNLLNLTTPYIVNGCQTTRTIWDVLSGRLAAGGTGDNPKLTEWKKNLARGVVVVKIVKVSTRNATLLNEITRYTNSQNAVTEKDFVALHEDFQTWATDMAEDYHVFLEIQRGGWDSQRAFQKQHPSTTQFKETANAFALLKVYGAGWMGLPGMAFGKNPPFLPGGDVFHEILNRVDGSTEPFSVADVYAAYLLHKLADDYKFGRGADKASRGTSRYLFYYIFTELLKQLMAQASIPTLHESVTKNMKTLLAPENKSEATELANAAAELIDEYLTQGANENTVDNEPTWSGNLNQFLKSDKVGQVAFTPKLRQLLGDYGRLLNRASRAGDKPPRERIVAKLKARKP